MESVSIYHLIIERQPGDFKVINIEDLGNKTDITLSSLVNIDTFTAKFTLEELKKLIEEKNVVPTDYLDGEIRLIRDVNKKNTSRHKVIYSDTFKDFDLSKLLEDNITDKAFCNKIYNGVFAAINKHKEAYETNLEKLLIEFKTVLDIECYATGNDLKRQINGKTYKVLALFNKLDRADQRKILFYIKEKLVLEQNKDMVRELSSVA